MTHYVPSPGLPELRDAARGSSERTGCAYAANRAS